jgi:hypothetical protein
MPGVTFRSLDQPVCEVALVTGPDPSIATMQLCKLVGRAAPVVHSFAKPVLALAA